MNPESISLPSYWRTRKERYSLQGEKLELSNPGKVVIFRGNPFHLEEDGRTLRAFSNEELQKFAFHKTSLTSKVLPV